MTVAQSNIYARKPFFPMVPGDRKHSIDRKNERDFLASWFPCKHRVYCIQRNGFRMDLSYRIRKKGDLMKRKPFCPNSIRHILTDRFTGASHGVALVTEEPIGVGVLRFDIETRKPCISMHSRSNAVQSHRYTILCILFRMKLV